MSEHTKGRLAYQENSDAYTHILRDEGGGFILQLSQDKTGKSEANARRLAACWNACEGLSQDHFDGDWTAKGLSKYAKSLEEKSAALEKELAAARALLREVLYVNEWTVDTERESEAHKRARDYLDACDTLGSGNG